MSRRVKLSIFVFLSSLSANTAPTNAAETLTYTYDAKGRLVKVVHAGTANNGVQAVYNYDKADNRQTTTTTGASN